MDCNEIKDLLSDYIDELLPSDVAEDLQQHLDTCPDCAGELAELKALVSELGDLDILDPIRPPDDFLAQLHQKIQHTSRFSRVLKALFVPFKIKIPLEFAGAAVAAILVFMVIHQQRLNDTIPLPHKPLKQRSVAHEEAGAPHRPAASPMVTSDRASEYRGKADSLKRGVSKPTLYELSLVIREGASPREAAAPLASVGSMQGFGEKKGVFADKEEPSQAMKEPLEQGAKQEEMSAPSDTGVPLPETELSPFSPPFDTILWRVRNVVAATGGTVLDIEYDQDERKPQSILVEISAHDFLSFMERLNELGELTAPLTIPTEASDGMIHLRINFRLP